MPEATAENLTEMCEEYMKSLVEFAGVLQKIKEKICNICPNRELCKVREKNKKLVEERMRMKNIPELTAFVCGLVEYVTDEIYLQATLATLKAPEKGVKINVE